MTGERPSHSGASGFGCTTPQTPARSTPKTTRAIPLADSAVPTRSRRGRGPEGGTSAIFRLSNRMPRTTITSPANTSRHDRYVVKKPPMSGPAATAMALAEATSP